MSQKTLKINTLIFGGGVSGLWLLNKLKQANHSALLLENNALGAGQTICSQGIIHSGVKYALSGKLSKSAQAIKDMPAIWQSCLDGKGEIDLSSVSVLSQKQLMWSMGSLAADLTTFFASKSLASRVAKLEKGSLPEIFSHKSFKGSVYELREPVLDAESLVNVLMKKCEENIAYYNLSDTEFQQHGVVLKNKNITIAADNIILLAGEGNQELVAKFKLHKKPKMQLRPLHMSYIKSKLNNFPMLYAHCMQTSTKPRITISSYQYDDEVVWYLGGDLAETGVKRDRKTQNNFVKKELKLLFPHWDFGFDSGSGLNSNAVEVDSFIVNRAEAKQRFGQRPDMPEIFQEKNIIVAWPTKLAFAPLLAEMIMRKINKNKQEQGGFLLAPDLDLGLPRSSVAKPVWRR